MFRTRITRVKLSFTRRLVSSGDEGVRVILGVTVYRRIKGKVKTTDEVSAIVTPYNCCKSEGRTV